MSILVKYVQCPRCAANGKDRKKSNLGVYSDGHSYCYSCKLYLKGDKIKAFKAEPIVEKQHLVHLPSDCDVHFPSSTVHWMEQYELDKKDMNNHNVLWSEEKQRLIFPFYSDETLLGWQGRYFGNEKRPKWYSKGNLQDVFHIIGRNKQKLVLVEDVVSAIKVSKIYSAMPLFGCSIPMSRWKRIKLIADYVIVFLDPDKKKEAISQVNIGRSIGINAVTHFANKDPKEIPYNELMEMLNG